MTVRCSGVSAYNGKRCYAFEDAEDGWLCPRHSAPQERRDLDADVDRAAAELAAKRHRDTLTEAERRSEDLRYAALREKARPVEGAHGRARPSVATQDGSSR